MLVHSTNIHLSPGFSALIPVGVSGTVFIRLRRRLYTCKYWKRNKMLSKASMIIITLVPITLYTLVILVPRQFHVGPREKNPLDGCLHVFLDLGSNRGIQIRKLYQPDLFPDAPVLKIFDRYFGPFAERNLSQVCAVGFEPNPRHESLLKETESVYNQCGWKVGTYSSGRVLDNCMFSPSPGDHPHKDGCRQGRHRDEVRQDRED